MTNLKKVHFHYITKKTITQTTGQGFCENIQDLHALLDALGSSDGQKPRVTKIRVFLRAFTTTDQNPLTAVPIVVQTAGTFTDDVDIAPDDISVMLATVIDDIYGIQIIGQPKCSTLKNISDDTGVEAHYIWETSFDIPRNLLNILNKETETERLQNLILGLVGIQTSTTGVYVLTAHAVVHYTEVRKGITIR